MMKSEPTTKERIDKLRSLVRSGKASADQVLDCVNLLRQSGIKAGDWKTWRSEVTQIVRQGLSSFPESAELTEELARAVNPYGDRAGDPKLLQKAIRLYEAQGKFPQADGVANSLASDILNEGCEALEQGDLRSARGHFERAINIYPLHADAYVHLGIAYEDAGNWLDAVRCYWRGIELGRVACHKREVWNRRMAEVWKTEEKTHYWGELDTRPLLRGLYYLAFLYYKRKQFDRALFHAEESLHLNPNDNTGVRFIAYSICRFQERDEELRKMNKEYGRKDLVEEAAQLERRCFGSELTRNHKKAPN